MTIWLWLKRGKAIMASYFIKFTKDILQKQFKLIQRFRHWRSRRILDLIIRDYDTFRKKSASYKLKTNAY